MKMRDWNDILNKCELIEIQSFKPNRENKLFGYTWNVYKNWPCTISQKVLGNPSDPVSDHSAVVSEIGNKRGAQVTHTGTECIQ